MKIALVHDYLREYGGAERVVEALHALWPEAPLYTSFVDWKALGRHAERFASWDIRTSWVQNNVLVRKFHSPLRFLAPLVWESLDLSGYDVVISSSGWYMCRGVRVPQSAVHICYIHHPPRNLYGYPTGSTLQKYPLVRIYATIINFFLRHYDFDTAQRVGIFVANSQETARRVRKFYKRESTVIYPPVATEHTSLKNTARTTPNKQSFFVCVGRLSWAKRIDVAIGACNELKIPLKVVGVGKEESYLRSIAGPTIEFLGSVDDGALKTLYQDARALLFCALDEDFGMVPVEAMAHGVPVIALKQGGVKETVVEGKTGVFFDDPSVTSLVQAIRHFEAQKFTRQACVQQAEKFSVKAFREHMTRLIEKEYKKNLKREVIS